MELKTTPIINKLNRIIAADDSQAMDALVFRAFDQGPAFTHLDYLALGRARIAYHGGREGWRWVNRARNKMDDPSRLSVTVGTIAARVERRSLTNPNDDPSPKEIDLTNDFLATAHTAARHHPDADVRAIAAWAEGQLEQHHARQWGLIPE